MRQVPRSPRRASICRSVRQSIGSKCTQLPSGRFSACEPSMGASHPAHCHVGHRFSFPGCPRPAVSLRPGRDPLRTIGRPWPRSARAIWLLKVGGHMCAGTVLLSCKRMMALLIRQSARSQRKGRSCLTTESSVRAPTPHRRILVVKTKSRALPPRPKPVGDANSARPMFDFTASNRRRSASGFDDNDGGQRRRASG